MKRPGSAEGGGMLASLGGGSKGTGGPAVLKPLAPPPSYTPTQVSRYSLVLLVGPLHLALAADTPPKVMLAHPSKMVQSAALNPAML